MENSKKETFYGKIRKDVTFLGISPLQLTSSTTSKQIPTISMQSLSLLFLFGNVMFLTSRES